MDGRRFDDLTRGLARETSRRRVLKGLAGTALGGTLVALGFKGGVRPAAAADCTLGDNSTCSPGQECCPVHNNPGATICTPVGVSCAQQACAADGDPCVYDSECCTDGAVCAGNVCTLPSSGGGAEGDPCTTGTQNPCADGLTCCATTGRAGGPGICHATCPPDTCLGAGDTCSSNADCCSGKCSDAGTCYCSDPARPTVGCPCDSSNANTCGGHPDLCCSDGTCASPMVGCNPTGGGEGDPCTTGTQNPCNDGLQCCPTTTRAGGPGVCKAASSTCPPVLPNTGSGQTHEASASWVAPAALLGAGAALVAAKRRLRSERESE